MKLVGFVSKTIAPLSSVCTFTSFGVHKNVKLHPTAIVSKALVKQSFCMTHMWHIYSMVPEYNNNVNLEGIIII